MTTWSSVRIFTVTSPVSPKAPEIAIEYDAALDGFTELTPV
jgi:hypothetical protein